MVVGNVDNVVLKIAKSGIRVLGPRQVIRVVTQQHFCETQPWFGLDMTNCIESEAMVGAPRVSSAKNCQQTFHDNETGVSERL